jgi:Etoposide-induced protein 2.4 (EI24)
VNRVFDAFWRAAAYCVHPRVILWSLLPLLAAGALVFALGWFFWEDAVTQVRAALEEWSLIASLLLWLESIGGGAFRSVIAPLIVVALAVPVIVVGTLLLVAWLMTPALVNLVVERRFAGLERRGGASAWWQGVLWSIGCTLVALLVLGISIPLWFVPPLVLVLPPLVWGWLASRVLAFDALAAHATPGERRLVLHLERWRLLAMGVVCGLLGSAPSMVWAMGALALVFAPVIAVVSVWLYTLVFAFASLWFAHFSLARLQALRTAHAARVSPTPVIESITPA